MIKSDRLGELLEASFTVEGTPLLDAEEVLALIEYSRGKGYVPHLLEAYEVRGDVRTLLPHYGLRIEDREEDPPPEEDCSREHMRSAILDLPPTTRSWLRFCIWFDDELDLSAK